MTVVQRSLYNGSMTTKKTGQELLAQALKKSSQATIAKRLGVTQQCVSRWLLGSRPNTKAAVVLRDVLRVPINSWK